MHNFKKNLGNPYLQFTFYFLLICLFVFLPYFFTGSSLIWNADGITQHFPALLSWRETLRTLIFNHHLISQWNWHIGLGADYLQTFSYYTIGDIFTYPVAFIPVKAVPIFYSLMIPVRLYLAGISFIWASKYFNKFSAQAQSLAAISYTFFGYTAFAAFEHPFFLTPLIILPLLLVAIQQAVVKQRYLLLLLIGTWTLINNFYFAFMLTSAALIYWAILWIIRPEFRNKVTIFKLILTALACLAQSAIIFLPSLAGLLSSARSGKSLANGLIFYPLNYYLALPGMLIGNLSTPSFWFTGGFSILAIFALIFSFRHLIHNNCKRWLLITLIVLILILPFFAGLMNGGSSPSNRWLFLANFPLSLCLAYLIDHYSEIDRHDLRYMFIFSVIASISLLYSSNFSLQSVFGLLVALLIFSLAILFNQGAWHRLLPLVIIMNALVTMNLYHQNNSDPKATQLLTQQAANSLVAQQKNYPQVGNSSNRVYIENQLGDVTGISPASNLPLLSTVKNIESYWSLQNGNVGQLMQQLGITNSSPNDVVSNVNLDSNLLNILGVNQLFLNNKTKLPNFTSTTNTVNNQNQLLSKSAYPLFYETPYQMTSTAFNQLSSSTKGASLVDTTVLTQPNKKTSKSAFAQTLHTAKISYNDQVHYQTSSHIKWSNKPSLLPNGIFLKANSNLKGTELHLEITNLSGRPFGFSGRLKHVNALNQFNQNLMQQNPSLSTDYRDNTKAANWNWIRNNLNDLDNQISGYTFSANYLGNQGQFTQTGQNNLSFYNPRKTININLGPARDYQHDQFIPFKFSKVGNYEFTARVVAVPVDQRFTKNAQAIQASAPKYKITKDHITIKPHVRHTTQLITSTIPYSTGWHSSNAEIVKVNSAFIGLKVPANQHTVNLVYRTPYLKFASLLSGAALIITLVYLLVRYLKRR